MGTWRLAVCIWLLMISFSRNFANLHQMYLSLVSRVSLAYLARLRIRDFHAPMCRSSVSGPNVKMNGRYSLVSFDKDSSLMRLCEHRRGLQHIVNAIQQTLP